MKKIIGILFFIVILVATSVLAAYPEELENKELEQLKEGNIIELTNEQVKEAEKLIVEPANDNTNILNESNDKMYEESDLYEINEEISITKRVNGNVYAMGQKIKIDGAVIKGNAFILGQEIEIKNVQIEGSLYVFGEKIEFSGVVNDLYACGSNITIDESGNIWRDVKIAGSIVEVNGTIGRNAFIAVNELSVGENTVINGELNYISQNQAEVSSNSKIGNE